MCFSKIVFQISAIKKNKRRTAIFKVFVKITVPHSKGTGVHADLVYCTGFKKRTFAHENIVDSIKRLSVDNFCITILSFKKLTCAIILDFRVTVIIIQTLM